MIIASPAMTYKGPAHGRPGLCVRLPWAGSHVGGAADTLVSVLERRPCNGLDMTSTLIGLYGVSQVFSADNFRKPQNKEICTNIGKIFPPMKNPVHVEDYFHP